MYRFVLCDRLTAPLVILTECYFQSKFRPFGGILRVRDLSVVFSGSQDLSVLQNQFSLGEPGEARVR